MTTADIRALEARLLAPRWEAEERQLLMEMYRLVSEVRVKAEPHMDTTDQLDLPEQRLLEHMIFGREDEYLEPRSDACLRL